MNGVSASMIEQHARSCRANGPALALGESALSAEVALVTAADVELTILLGSAMALLTETCSAWPGA